MGVAAIGERTDDGFGREKANHRPITNRTAQLTAEEYNRLADAVIELQEAAGTTTSPAAGSFEYRIDQAASDILALSTSFGDLVDDVSALTTTVSGHTTSLGTLSTTVSGHASSIATLTTDVSTAQDTADQAASDVSALSTTVSGHTTSLGTLSTTVSGHASSIATLTTDVSTAQDTADQAASDILALSTTVTSLSTTVSGHASSISTLTTDVSTAQSAATAAQTAATAAQSSADSHASRHAQDGADPIDGDKVETGFVPTNYTRDTTGTSATAVNQIAAHLKGIDTKLASSGIGVTVSGTPAAGDILLATSASAAAWTNAVNHKLLLDWQGTSTITDVLAGNGTVDCQWISSSWTSTPAASIVADSAAPGGNVLRLSAHAAGTATGEFGSLFWLNVTATYRFLIEIDVHALTGASGASLGPMFLGYGTGGSSSGYGYHRVACTRLNSGTATAYAGGHAGTPTNTPYRLRVWVRGDKRSGLTPKFTVDSAVSWNGGQALRTFRNSAWTLEPAENAGGHTKLGLYFSPAANNQATTIDISSIRVVDLT